MDKPFKSIDQQIDLLENRGMIVPDRNEARQVLLGTNYYNIINGYKDSFTVRTPKGEAFRDGTTIIHMQLLYTMDAAFRNVTLSTLFRAESLMKSTLVHAFCEAYGGGDSYLEDHWYRPIEAYQKKRYDYEKNRDRLSDTLRHRRDNDRRKEYVQHYIDAYDCVPLWVLASTLSFGDVSMLFDFQLDKVQNRMCSFVCEVSGKRVIPPRKMQEAFNILTQFRNICAHGERFYCARVGARGNWGFADLLRAMSIVLTEKEVADYARSLKSIIDSVEDAEGIRQIVLSGMGVSYDFLSSYARQEDARPHPGRIE